MAKLVFKGCETRGKELKELLQYLGGIDSGYDCSRSDCYYYINNEGFIEGNSKTPLYMTNYIEMILDEFESKYPYKIGDKVISMEGYHGQITKMHWDECNCTVRYTFKDDEVGTNRRGYTSTMLKPYKKEETIKKEISCAIVDRFICLEGYDFYDDKGNIIDTKEITMKKKKPQYPKNFIECAKILDVLCAAYIDGYKWELLENLQELLICRDAYWKLAGDWKPEFRFGKKKYSIMTKDNKVISATVEETNRILVFPTEEMRDAFYENFKELIESCKELL